MQGFKRNLVHLGRYHSSGYQRLLVGISDYSLLLPVAQYLMGDADKYGELSEWFMELVLKTSDSLTGTVGSNPSLSASAL